MHAPDTRARALQLNIVRPCVAFCSSRITSSFPLFPLPLWNIVRYPLSAVYSYTAIAQCHSLISPHPPLFPFRLPLNIVRCPSFSYTAISLNELTGLQLYCTPAQVGAGRGGGLIMCACRLIYALYCMPEQGGAGGGLHHVHDFCFIYLRQPQALLHSPREI